MQSKSTILKVERISFFVKKKNILKNINFTLKEGNIYALLGANGSGKTTLFKVILGLLNPNEGKMLFQEKLYGHHNRIEVLRKIGSLIEQASLYNHLTAFENLEQARRIYGTAKSETFRLLEIVGLKENQTERVKTFSLGMKQRLGIALAMIGKPDLVLLDEPTNGLDPQGVADLRSLILHLNQTDGTTFLIASHHLQEIGKMASDIIFIEKGQIIHQEKLDKTQIINLEELYSRLTLNQ
jgi:ABC-2 type transport system ATP-binding protein